MTLMRTGLTLCFFIIFSQAQASPQCGVVFQKRDWAATEVKMDDFLFSPPFYAALSSLEVSIKHSQGQEFHFLGAENLSGSDFHELAILVYNKMGEMISSGHFLPDERYLYPFLETPKEVILEEIEVALVTLSLTLNEPHHPKDLQEQSLEPLGVFSVAILTLGAVTGSSRAKLALKRHQEVSNIQRDIEIRTKKLNHLWSRGLDVKQGLEGGDLSFDYSEIYKDMNMHAHHPH